MPDVITVENYSGAAQFVQACFEGVCEGGLSGSGQPGKPDDDAFMAMQPVAFGTGDCGLVPYDVVAFH
jgi:hypothetical protein